MPSQSGFLGLSCTNSALQRQECFPDLEREAVLDLLRLINRGDGLRDLVRDVTILMRAWSGCEAVGVRLRDGKDFPYFETLGFPREHIRQESRLCSVNDKGELIRDSADKPVLRCLCGRVLCGDHDPSLPFFTESGSFWTGSTSDLLTSAQGSELPGRNGIHCHGEGYESVALVPIRHNNRILGLLQFNDPRQDAFSEDTVRVMERLASCLGTGLTQRERSMGREKSVKELDTLSSRAPQAMFLIDSEKRVCWTNSAAEALAGSSTGKLHGARGGEALRCVRHLNTPHGCGFGPECEGCAIRNTVLATFQTGESYHQVEAELPVIRDHVRHEVHLLVSTSYLRHNGEPHVLLLLEDISERKRMERTLQSKTKELSLLLNHTPTQVCYFIDPETYGAVNRSHAEFVGKPKFEIEYNPLSTIFPPEICFACREENKKIFATAQPRHCQTWLPDFRGRLRLLALSKIPYLNDSGKTEYIVCSGQEITPSLSQNLN